MSSGDQGLEGHEYPDPQDMTPDAAEADLVSCPHCRAPVYEEAQQCPHCGEWIIDSQHGRGLVWTIAVLALIGLLVVVWIF